MDSEAVRCPFCGAPYREVIPANVVQLRCKYCGGTFQVPLGIEAGLPRCPNHPEKLAMGICNDCGRSFCGECLHDYSVSTKEGRGANLYLCPECLRARYGDRARGLVLSGAFMLLGGMVFFAFMFSAPLFVPGMLLFPVFFLLLGIGMMTYGVLVQSGRIEESTFDDSRGRRRSLRVSGTRGTEEKVDSKEMYDKLLGEYVSRWGSVGSGVQLLDEEIKAYMRHGESFDEAVAAVYERHKNKSR